MCGHSNEEYKKEKLLTHIRIGAGSKFNIVLDLYIFYMVNAILYSPLLRFSRYFYVRTRTYSLRFRQGQ